MGNYDEARLLFGRAIKANSKVSSWSWQPWAIMEKDLGNYREARRLFGRATKADPKRAAVWQPWALLELEVGNYNKALQLAQRAVDLDPRGFQVYIARGQIQRALGNPKQAKKDFKQAKKNLQRQLMRRGRNTRLLNLMGRILTYLGDYKQAEINLLHSLEWSMPHQRCFVHNGLGELYEAQGMLDKAISEWERTLEYLPHYLKAQINLDRVRQQIDYGTIELPKIGGCTSREGTRLTVTDEASVLPEGYIKMYNKGRGFGFISRINGADVFFHISRVINSDAIEIGAGVTFELKDTLKGQSAINVFVIEA